jgi:hypothetical protein
LCTTDACLEGSDLDDNLGTVTNTADEAACDDGEFCTGIEGCDPADAGADAAGCFDRPLVLSDDSVCTVDDCDEVADQITHVDIDIDDADACTTDSCDAIAGESHVAVDVDDDDACTADSCDPIAGVLHATIAEDDGIACTVDSCDTLTGVSNVPDDSACGFAQECDPDLDCVARVPVGRVSINEIRFGVGFALELRNNTSSDVDVSGFTLLGSDGSSATITGQTQPLVLAAGGVIAGVPAGGPLPADAAFVLTGTLPVAADNLVLRLDNVPAQSPGGGTEDLLDIQKPIASGTPGATNFPISVVASTQLDRDAAGNDDVNQWCLSFRANSFGAANKSCRDEVVINEVLYDFKALGVGGDDQHDFVELGGGGGALLTGLRVRSTGELTKVLVPGSRMPMDGLFVLADGVGGVTQVPEADLIQNAGQLPNGDGGVQLVVDVGGAVLDAVAWGSVLGVGEGTQLPDVEPAAMSIVFARDESSTDTNDNLADFALDPSASPGLANLPVQPRIEVIAPSSGQAFVTTSVTLIVRDAANFTNINGITTNRDPIANFAGVDAATCIFTIVSEDGRGPSTVTCNAPARNGNARQIPEGIIGDVTWTNPAAIGGVDVDVGGFTYFDGSANETDIGVEADFCNIQFPASPILVPAGTTVDIFSQLFEDGLTNASDAQAPGVLAQFGLGRAGNVDLTTFNYTAATFNTSTPLGNPNNDEYAFKFQAPSVAGASFNFVFRYSLDDGLNWTHCDNDGAGSNPGLAFDNAQIGVIVVN